MEEAAQERRERLRALRAAAELSGATFEAAETNGSKAEEPGNGVEEEQKEDDDQSARELGRIRFRNYVPRDEGLLKLMRDPPVLPRFEQVIANDTDAPRTEDPMVSIAPKKANWDLRRDISKKLEKLEKRTARAIIELMPAEERNRKQLEEITA